MIHGRFLKNGQQVGFFDQQRGRWRVAGYSGSPPLRIGGSRRYNAAFSLAEASRDRPVLIAYY